jgi:hypothetical protein
MPYADSAPSSGEAAPCSDEPHVTQKLASGAFSCPQAAQVF